VTTDTTIQEVPAATAESGAPDDDVLIDIRNLSKHFKISRRENLVAVGGVDLSIGRGETVGLVGESGSGKTTLGRVMLRLTEPTGGDIWYGGERISHMSGKEFRKVRPKLQMVFQDPSNSLNPRMTIRTALRDAVRILKLPKGEREQRIAEVLDAVQVSDVLADSHPEALTGSQQQRCAVARSLVMQPDLIVLDEAVSNLDVGGRLEIIELLQDVQERFGVSYLFISHDLTAVRSISHRVAVMYLGLVVEFAPTDTIFESPVHPYTRSLLSAVLYPDPNAGLPEYILSGEIPSPINLPPGCNLYSRCPVREDACEHWDAELFPVERDGAEAKHTAACRRLDDILAGRA
jgi:oligopeptide/dipeptide ABC transporter ATP-binding protein